MGLTPPDARPHYRTAYEQATLLVQAFVMILVIFFRDGLQDCTRVQKNHKLAPRTARYAAYRRIMRRTKPAARGSKRGFRGPNARAVATCDHARGGYAGG